jgi:hypothetical protein
VTVAVEATVAWVTFVSVIVDKTVVWATPVLVWVAMAVRVMIEVLVGVADAITVVTEVICFVDTIGAGQEETDVIVDLGRVIYDTSTAAEISCGSRLKFCGGSKVCCGSNINFSRGLSHNSGVNLCGLVEI